MDVDLPQVPRQDSGCSTHVGTLFGLEASRLPRAGGEAGGRIFRVVSLTSLLALKWNLEWVVTVPIHRCETDIYIM